MDGRKLTIDQKNVAELFNYNSDTGEIFWNVIGKGRTKKKAAGTVTSNGYVGVLIDGTRYYAHRIVWFLHHKKWPQNQIDHINGIKTDNRIENLREATNSQNGKNYGENKSNTSGFKGVSFCKQTNRWRAVIKVDGKTKSLGRFLKKNDAIEKRKTAEILYFGEWRRAV